MKKDFEAYKNFTLESLEHVGLQIIIYQRNAKMNITSAAHPI